MFRRGKQQKCNCGGYHFPHRRGSKYCELNPHYAEHWTERHDANTKPQQMTMGEI